MAVRRWTHASTALVLLLPQFLGWPLTRWILIAAFLGESLVELGRLRSGKVAAFLTRKIPLFREREATRPSGAFWLVVGHTVCSWFPPAAAAMGILAASLADPAAAWAGKFRGRTGTKTTAGSAAAAAVTAGVALVLGAPVWRALVVGVAAAAAERYSGPLDDNLLVGPVAAGLFFWLT